VRRLELDLFEVSFRGHGNGMASHDRQGQWNGNYVRLPRQLLC
jgi:hypothetical protein